MASTFTYAVIGAGIEGSATAYYLAKNGFKTVLLDQVRPPVLDEQRPHGFRFQFRQGHTRGSSHGNSRIIRKTYDEPEYVHLMKRAYPLWAELEKECGEQLYR